jgi:peptidoglycan hydrolase-like protein with peptidoglycan-binding domain
MADSSKSIVHALGSAPQPIQLQPGVPITIVVTRSLPRVRLLGMFFETDKCFLLPAAMQGIRGIKRQYDLHPNSNLLIVGHTDTSASETHNSNLSLERADAVAAYLTDAIDAWEKFFHPDGKRSSLQWGTREIQLMLSALPADATPFFSGEVDGIHGPITSEAVRNFQAQHGLAANGNVDEATRRTLIQAYMDLDETTLPSGIHVTTHGCGEFFPVSQSGDGAHVAEDRRVEAFFFDGAITPPPPSKLSKRGSGEYPQWVAQVTETDDFTTDQSLVRLVLRLLDPDRNPRAGVEYVLVVGSDTFAKQTNANGIIDHLVSSSALTGTLHVDGSEFTLDVRALAASQTLLGVQQRLNNLGYDPGPPDGQLTPQTQGAIRQFQSDVGLPTSGQADASTIAALRSTYGS